MKHQHGFGLLAYGIVALLILGALSSIGYIIRRSGYEAAMLEVAERDRLAAEQEKARAQAREALARLEAQRLLKAQEAAAAANQKWQEARNELRRKQKPLIIAECPSGGGLKPAPAGAPRLRLAWEFVSLYDAAWTDSDGKPVFGFQRGGVAAGSEAGASPYAADDLLDVHGENAKRCSENARRLDALTAKIGKLRVQWGAP